jgi:hypothetical protein
MHALRLQPSVGAAGMAVAGSAHAQAKAARFLRRANAGRSATTAILRLRVNRVTGFRTDLSCARPLRLAEAVGIGTTDLGWVEVAGLSITEAFCDFGPGTTG